MKTEYRAINIGNNEEILEYKKVTWVLFWPTEEWITVTRFIAGRFCDVTSLYFNLDTFIQKNPDIKVYNELQVAEYRKWQHDVRLIEMQKMKDFGRIRYFQ